MNDKLRAAHEKLEQAVAEIASGDDWQRMLQVASKFHRYGFNNHLMIFLQRPDATVGAGFNRWKSLVRFVKKGEKGIAIFAPCRYKTTIETDAGEEQTVQQITRLPRPARLRYLTDGRRRPPGRALRGPALLPGRGLPPQRPSPRVASRHGRHAVRQGRR